MNDIKDVKPPINLPDLWWLLCLLVLIAVAVGIYFFLRYKKSSSRAIKAAGPGIAGLGKSLSTAGSFAAGKFIG